MASHALELPDHAHRDALASAIGIARRLGVPKESLYIGAGTALAMRWKHRPLTGIWLFVNLKPRNLPGGHPAFMNHSNEEILAQIQAEGGTHAFVDGIPWSKWKLGDVFTGIYGSNPPIPHQSEDVEAETGLMVENSVSAFHKKLASRIKGTGELVPRDAVDMAELSCRNPKELRELIDWHGIARTCAEEARWQARIDPEEALKDLWLLVARIFEGDLASGSPPRGVPKHLFAHHPGNNQAGSPFLVDILPDEAFLHPILQERSPLREERFDLQMGQCMAGHPLSPDGKDIQNWLRTEKPEDMPDNSTSYMREFFKQLHGTNLFAFRQSCGASLRDMARMARWTDFLMSPRLKSGINRPARLLASGDRTEEFEAYRLLKTRRNPA